MSTKIIRTLIVGFLAALLTGPTAFAGKGGDKDKDKDETEQDEEQEQTLTLEQLPSQVRTTVEAEAQGGKIIEIEMENGKDGKVLFEVEILKGGQKVEVLIASDGSVIKRKVIGAKRK